MLCTSLQADPIIYAIAGSPASGKTTFVQKKIQENYFPEDIFVHDCDAVMVALEGYQSDVQLLGSAKAFQKWELPAREMAEAMLLQAVKERKNIIYDRSCALPSSYTFLKDLVDNQGYTLIMHVLYVKEEVAFSRAEEREKTTSRHTPKEILSERMTWIRALWPSYLNLAKLAYLHDSNDTLYKVIATGKDSELIILDEKGYAAFMQQ